MRRIVTAVAAIALVAGAAQAQAQGNSNGNGKDRGGGKSADAGSQGGNGGTRGQGNGASERGNRGPGNGVSMVRAASSDNRGGGNEIREQRGNGADADRGKRGNGRSTESQVERRAERAAGDNRGRGNADRAVAIDRRGVDVRVRDFTTLGTRGLISGCPPGLAKKRNGCQPPGQARKDARWGWDRPDFWGLSGLGDGRYFYDDGYLVRLGADGGIGGFIPLLGGALGIGNAWPSSYEPVALPRYYERFYGLGQSDSYRYADNVVYRVDPQTSAITSIAALLTGDNFAVGQRMPLGYDVYNVPYEYRDRYNDGPDANYRYADGHIYQVDPQTRLIAAAIELLT